MEHSSSDVVNLRHALAPRGVLRVALNHANFLLVSHPAPDGAGIAADLGRELARQIGVDAAFVGYEHAGLAADAAARDEWDVAFIGADPSRADVVFSPAYVGIEATYLVPTTSGIKRTGDVDQPGTRIAVANRSAYHLVLERTIRHATLVLAESLPASEELFTSHSLEALAGLRPHLLDVARRRPTLRVLDDSFMSVQQAIGVPRNRTHAAGFIAEFVRKSVSSGLVAQLIAHHKVQGLVVQTEPRPT